MELYFLSVGYGEAIVLIDGAHCLVMDGGPGSEDEAYDQPGTIRLADFLPLYLGKASMAHGT